MGLATFHTYFNEDINNVTAGANCLMLRKCVAEVVCSLVDRCWGNVV